jgi:signal transduction histidine kinase
MPPEVGILLRSKRTTILQRWQLRVADMTQALNVSRIELVDHMPSFVDGMIALFERQPIGVAANEAPAHENAPLHGAQRLSIGFDVDEVVREYGILADVLLEVVGESGTTLPTEEQRRLIAVVNAGAAEAVREYVRRRDEELVREQARHRAFIAHELRTPLTTALAASSLLGQQHPPLSQGRPMQLLGRSLGQVRDLIDQVLIAGRLDAGVAPNRDDLELVAMVRDLAELFVPEADGRDVRVELDLPDALHISADRRLLHSAIANLLRNAIKYTRESSTVRVSLRAGDDVVTCAVADGCGGITDGNWTQIFEPFARGDDAATRQRDGLGLGLAIAKQAAEAHGGSLAVRNVDSTGCSFELRIPRVAPSAD